MSLSVTVLMSTYNGEKYLAEQIESILSQTQVDVRLVIRDDGSSDSTLSILREYKKHENVFRTLIIMPLQIRMIFGM